MDNQGDRTMTLTVKIPKTFIEDHSSRECLVVADGSEYGQLIRVRDVTVRELKKHYIVALTAAQALELLSDATYYAEVGVRDMGWHMGGLVASARATRDALIKAGV
jgi:hypothetical protein